MNANVTNNKTGGEQHEQVAYMSIAERREEYDESLFIC